MNTGSGLVSAAGLPGQGIDLAAVSAHARTLASVGAGFEAGTSAASTAWLRVPGEYESTGTESLYSAMVPVAEKGREVHRALSGAERALNAYADAAAPVLAKIAALRADIAHFQASAASSYPKAAPVVADYNGYTTAGGASATPGPQYASWQDDPVARAANDGLAARARQLAEELLNLQQECAAAIRRAAGMPGTGTRPPRDAASYLTSTTVQRGGAASAAGGHEGCASSTGRALGGLFHDGFANVTGRVAALVGGTASAVGLVGAVVPKAWWQAESWVHDTAVPAAGVAGTMALQWGSDRLAELAAAQRSVNRAILNHPDEVVTLGLGVLGVIGGGAMEAGGVALDLSVVGAPVGAALNITGANVIAVGGGAAAIGAGQLAIHAASDDRVDPQYSEVNPKKEPHPTYPNKLRDGTFAGKDGQAADLEQKGLDEVDKEGIFDDKVNRSKVKAHVDGVEQGRFYDGLGKNPDGTYTGIEIKSMNGSRNAAQREFDQRVLDGHPAHARLGDETIEITDVIERKGIKP